MLIDSSITDTHIKFISYTGSYPNLCSGDLALEIDGIEYTFGYGYEREPKPDFKPFWSSGGSVWFDDGWEENVEDGEWAIDVNRLPEQFRKYAFEIDRIFNENVEWGCCGGCI